MEILGVKNLKFAYPNEKKQALNGIDLSVEEGEILLVCGSSGSGKTTLLRLLKKELAPCGELQGEITLFGNAEKKADVFDIGFVMQNPHSQIVTDKVWHELAFALENMGLDKNTIRLRTGEMASFLGISSWFEKKTSELSGGQLQILNLASVMAMQPRILLLDEPVSQLDPIAAREFLNAVMRLNREMGTTVIMTEHRLEDAFVLADRVAVMQDGMIKCVGAPREVSERIIAEADEEMFASLPAAARIFSMTGGKGKCPLNVREGRAYLKERFSDRAGAKLNSKENEKTGDKLIRLKDLRFRYLKNSEDIIKDLSLDIYSGDNLCILGANGVGKSTLLKLICSRIKPYMGSVKHKKGLSFALLPQQAEMVFLKDSLIEDLKLTCLENGLGKEDAENKIDGLKQIFRLEGLLDRHPYDLSGGETQRAALAKLMICRPDVMLLDEPTKGIDPAGKRELAALVENMRYDGMTVVTVTHDIEYAASYSSRCAMLFNGEIISSGEPRSFFGGNSFYTTAANRISRGLFDNAISCGDVAKLCGF